MCAVLSRQVHGNLLTATIENNTPEDMENHPVAAATQHEVMRLKTKMMAMEKWPN